MKQLPEGEVYEKGLQYWPYKTSQKFVLDKVVELAPRGGRLLDIMCGPGNLLGKISELRPDLDLYGVDIDSRYIKYAKEKYVDATFFEGDVLKWKPSDLDTTGFDIVLCTGALHHIAYEQQEEAIANLQLLSSLVDGILILSDAYIDDYIDEKSRSLAAAKLGYEYLRETILNDATSDVLAWTVDILWNDVLKEEYKTSVNKRCSVLKKYFKAIKVFRTWPSENVSGEYGDYIHICSIV